MKSKMTKLSTSALALASFLPLAALGQTSADLGFFTNLVSQFRGILELLVPVIIGLGLILFLWNLFQYMRKAGDDKAKHAQGMVMGIVILAVMVAVWGLVRFAGDLVGIDVDSQTNAPNVPELPN